MRITPVSLVCIVLLGALLLAAGCTSDAPAAAPPTASVPAESPSPVLSPAPDPSPVPSPASGPAPAGTLPAPVPGEYTSNETLVAFVNSAADYVKAEGPERALAEFSNSHGTFMQGELYIYAYGFNGTTLAHPINPEKIGKTRDDEGAIGVFVREMGAVVKNGNGFYRFTYVNPAHNNTLESKLGYGVKVDDDWWLGSGIYTGPVNP